MKKEGHPAYHKVTATCACGPESKYEIYSTLKEDISLEVCAKCHPFYTGKQKILDKGGRVEKFRQRFNKGLLAK